jgi:hypothetical protein
MQTFLYESPGGSDLDLTLIWGTTYAPDFLETVLVRIQMGYECHLKWVSFVHRIMVLDGEKGSDCWYTSNCNFNKQKLPSLYIIINDQYRYKVLLEQRSGCIYYTPFYWYRVFNKRKPDIR